MRILGIFRGFPGLGRVVAGVSVLETLKDRYGAVIHIISYLQGSLYLNSKGYKAYDVTSMDYCSIGLLPTGRMGVCIHDTIRTFCPDLIIIDGEPLILQSIKISHPHIKIVALLNPSDVENPNNDKEAMEYFNTLYSMADLAVVHGLKNIPKPKCYNNFISTPTIIRNELLDIKGRCNRDIYCILGGGTVNVSEKFVETTIQIARLCQQIASCLDDSQIHIVCSSQNIYDSICKNDICKNVIIHQGIVDAQEYYSKASLIITRAGRNSLSELAYLNIPTIAFVTGDSYRRVEQEQNVYNIKAYNIKCLSLDISDEVFFREVKDLQKINAVEKIPKYIPGNELVLKYIRKLI